MEKILIQQNPHWDGQRYDNIIKRRELDALISLLSTDEVMVLLGVRRCGKTTMFKALINQLVASNDPKSILYINVDDPYFDLAASDPTFLYKIVETAEKMTGEKVQFLFLDEAQSIKKWEKFVKSTYDSHVFKKVFVTGSNSNLLQSDYTVLLSGRYTEHQLFPLRFSEMLGHHGIDNKIALIKNKAQVLSMFDRLLHYGSFPKPWLETNDNIKRKILASYYETILLKDCLVMSDIRDMPMLKKLSHYLISNTGARYSYNNLADYLSGSEHTIKAYIESLKNGFLIDEIPNFSFSLKKQSRGKKKVYCVDNGLITSVGFNFVDMEGQLFENLVLTELRKFNITEIYLFNELRECDFIVKINNEFLAIQVCYQVTNTNREREVSGLKLGMEKSKARQGLIVTYDQEERLDESMSIIPFWKVFSQIQRVEDIFMT